MNMEECYLHPFLLPERWALLGTSLQRKEESVSFSHDGASGQSKPEGEGVGTMISHWEAELRKK